MPRRPTHAPGPRGLSARLAGDRRAATAVEYGLILALIVLAMLAALKGMASGTTGMWSDINTKVTNASK